jgi:hypothetical protein
MDMDYVCVRVPPHACVLVHDCVHVHVYAHVHVHVHFHFHIRVHVHVHVHVYVHVQVHVHVQVPDTDTDTDTATDNLQKIRALEAFCLKKILEFGILNANASTTFKNKRSSVKLTFKNEIKALFR